METKNPENPQNIEGANEAPRAVGEVGGRVIEHDFTPAEVEAPFVPEDELEIAPAVAEPVTGWREEAPGGLPTNYINGTGALQQQFEGAQTTAAGPAHQTVLNFNRLKEDRK